MVAGFHGVFRLSFSRGTAAPPLAWFRLNESREGSITQPVPARNQPKHARLFCHFATRPADARSRRPIPGRPRPLGGPERWGFGRVGSRAEKHGRVKVFAVNECP